MSIDDTRAGFESLCAELTDLRQTCAALRARAERAEGDAAEWRARAERIAQDRDEAATDAGFYEHAFRVLIDALGVPPEGALEEIARLRVGRALRAPGGEDL